MKVTARKGYDETIVFPRGFTVAVVEHLGYLVLRVELHDSARVERMPLTTHEARQIASLLRNGTELDHIPHRSCDEALEAARTERDRLIDCGQDAALGCAEAPGCLRCFGNEVAKAQQERDAAGVREREHVTRAQDVADEMRRERDAAIAERDRLRAEVADLLPEADAKQHFATRALRAEERLQRLRRELEALQAHCSELRRLTHHAVLDDVADDIGAILRGEAREHHPLVERGPYR